MPKSDQGAVKGRYAVIPRTLIFITHEEKVLLLKGSPTKRLWANQYNGVGGHIEPGEDVLSAANRELFEETGLIVDTLALCGTVMVNTGGELGIAIFVFKGESASTAVTQSEEGILEWAPVTALDTFPLVEDLPILLPRILSQVPGKGIFSAYYFYNENDKLVVKINS